MWLRTCQMHPAYRVFADMNRSPPLQLAYVGEDLLALCLAVFLAGLRLVGGVVLGVACCLLLLSLQPFLQQAADYLEFKVHQSVEPKHDAKLGQNSAVHREQQLKSEVSLA